MQVVSRGTNVTHADMSLLLTGLLALGMSQPYPAKFCVRRHSEHWKRPAIVLRASPERCRPWSFFILDDLGYGLEHT